MSALPLPLLGALAAPLLLVGGWWALCALIGRGGWTRLGARFATDRPPPPARLRRSSAQVGSSAYDQTLTLAADADALYLGALPLLRPGHPRLRLPWGALAVQGQSRRGFATFQHLRVGDVDLTLLADDWAALRRAADGG